MQIDFVEATNMAAAQKISDKAVEIWKEHFTPIIGAKQVAYMLNLFLTPEAIMNAINADHNEFYQILKKDKIIGFFSIKKEEKRLFLSKLYVEKAQRGYGYAREALNYIELLAKQAGLHAIWLTCNKDNEHTLSVYHKMGFQIFDEAVNNIGNNYVMDDYYLSKEL